MCCKVTHVRGAQGDGLYPDTNNFFLDGSGEAASRGKLVERPSPHTSRSVASFLMSNGIEITEATRSPACPPNPPPSPSY